MRTSHPRHPGDHWPQVLKSIRRAAVPKVTPGQMAAQLGIDESYITRLERGHVLPTQEALDIYGRMAEQQRRWKE